MYLMLSLVFLSALTSPFVFFFFFFNATATTEIYTLSLHDALPISGALFVWASLAEIRGIPGIPEWAEWFLEFRGSLGSRRSEEHTSELQSRQYLVCRLLLEKKKKKKKTQKIT